MKRCGVNGTFIDNITFLIDKFYEFLKHNPDAKLCMTLNSRIRDTINFPGMRSFVTRFPNFMRVMN